MKTALIYKGWSVEIFAHNQTSYPAFFESDCKRARPCLPRMVSEGIILNDSKIAEEFIKAFDDFYKSGEKVKVVTLIDRILDPHGGRLFEGFSLGKE